jgi:hypothetical protein
MAHDAFALIVNFFRKDWMPKHIIIRLFEAFETVGKILIISLQNLFKYSLNSISR